MNNPKKEHVERSEHEYFSDEFQEICVKIADGIKTGEVTLSAAECHLLMIRMQTSVDIMPLTDMFHDLISKTLLIWKQKT